MKCIALVICLAGLSPMLWADGIPTGTWVRRAGKDGITSTVVVEASGAGQKLTFKVKVGDGVTSTMIVTTLWDGKDAPVYVDGKPSKETMAIRMVDDRHTINVLKMDGKPFVTQKSELSADGKVIKTESVPTAPGAQNTVEYWDKK